MKISKQESPKRGKKSRGKPIVLPPERENEEIDTAQLADAVKKSQVKKA